MKRAAITVLLPLMIYAAGAFFETTWNIKHWNEGTRGMIAFFALTAALSALFYPEEEPTRKP